jgi:hypothetical protein
MSGPVIGFHVFSEKGIRLKRIAILLALLTACGSTDDGGGTRARATSCDPADRQGTYFATFENLSGTCGEQTSALIRLDADADITASGCVLLAEDRWSDGNCTLERSSLCPLDLGRTVESTIISTQEDAAGDTITGTMTIDVEEADGFPVCFGTYRLTAVRQ